MREKRAAWDSRVMQLLPINQMYGPRWAISAPTCIAPTTNGDAWSRLTTGTNGIPTNYPTRMVREDPMRAGLLYAQTEFGMFISFDIGAQWQPFQLNLPPTPITDITVHGNDLVLSMQWRSFWSVDNADEIGKRSATKNPIRNILRTMSDSSTAAAENAG